MSQEFVDIASLTADPTNQVGLKFEEWGPKIMRYAQVQKKASTRELLLTADQEIPCGKMPKMCHVYITDSFHKIPQTD